MADPRQCPACGILPALSGEPNCDCDPVTVMKAKLPLTHDQIAPRVWTKRAIAMPTDETETCPVERPQRMEAKPGTEAQLRDLPDILTHLALRLTSSQPGAEPGGGRREAAHVAPVNIGILHALDDRRRWQSDDMLGALDDERWRCPHATHRPLDCPWEADDGGRQGVLADLDMWADWIFGDLEQWSPKLVDAPPQPATIHGTSGWLATHHCAWLALLDRDLAAETRGLIEQGQREFEREVHGWHTRLRHELGESDPVPLRHNNLGGCGGQLLPLADGIRHECVDCHEVLTPGEMLGLARWQSDVTLAEAAEALGPKLGITLGQLRQWVKRDTDFPQPVDDRYPARYLLRDLRDHAERRAGKRGRAG